MDKCVSYLYHSMFPELFYFPPGESVIQNNTKVLKISLELTEAAGKGEAGRKEHVWTGLLLFQMYDRAISAPTSPTRLGRSGKRSWEEPNWMGSPRLLNKDMKTGLSRSLQTLPTDSSAFDTGEKASAPSGTYLWALSATPACSTRSLST